MRTGSGEVTPGRGYRTGVGLVCRGGTGVGTPNWNGEVGPKGVTNCREVPISYGKWDRGGKTDRGGEWDRGGDRGVGTEPVGTGRIGVGEKDR